MPLSKRPFQIVGSENTEANAASVARKINIEKTTVKDISEGLRKDELFGDWIYSTANAFVVDHNLPVISQVPSGSLMMHVPYQCVVKEFVLFTNSEIITSGAIGDVHGQDHHIIFRWASALKEGAVLTEVGYNSSQETFNSKLALNVSGPYNFHLTKNEVLFASIEIVGTPLPTTSGTWQAKARIQRV